MLFAEDFGGVVQKLAGVAHLTGLNLLQHAPFTLDHAVPVKLIRKHLHPWEKVRNMHLNLFKKGLMACELFHDFEDFCNLVDVIAVDCLRISHETHQVCH